MSGYLADYEGTPIELGGEFLRDKGASAEEPALEPYEDPEHNPYQRPYITEIEMNPTTLAAIAYLRYERGLDIAADDPDPEFAAASQLLEAARQAETKRELEIMGAVEKGEVTEFQEDVSVLISATEQWVDGRGANFLRGLRNWRNSTQREVPYTQRREQKALATQAKIEDKRSKREERRLSKGSAGARYPATSPIRLKGGRRARRHRDARRAETSLFIVPKTT